MLSEFQRALSQAAPASFFLLISLRDQVKSHAEFHLVLNSSFAARHWEMLCLYDPQGWGTESYSGVYAGWPLFTHQGPNNPTCFCPGHRHLDSNDLIVTIVLPGFFLPANQLHRRVLLPPGQLVYSSH